MDKRNENLNDELNNNSTENSTDKTDKTTENSTFNLTVNSENISPSVTSESDSKSPEAYGTSKIKSDETKHDGPSQHGQNPYMGQGGQPQYRQNPYMGQGGKPQYGQNPYMGQSGQPQYGQNPYMGQSGQPYPPFQSPTQENPGKGFGITGFVLSLVSFLSCCLGQALIILGLSISGMVFSIIGRSKSRKAGQSHGLATAGMIISIVHTVFWVLMILFVVLLLLTGYEEILEEIIEQGGYSYELSI